ncbi:MAG: hypothetical protein K2I61_02695 [Muribaculaceae bacterium]|nr:hypothetical protein [Muribaculaceae bacterium]
MQEHLKKIMIPVADGSTHELVIPEEVDYGRMEAYARGQAATVRADLQRGVDRNSGLIEGLRSTCEQQAHRIGAQEESLARLHHELVVKPRLIARLVAIGYGDEEADVVVSPLSMEEAVAKVALREGLASIGYTPTETEECLEDVPALTQEDIDYARGLMEAHDPATTALTKTWLGDTRMVVFPKIDTSNVKSISQAWGGCSNLRYIPLIDTSNVVTAALPFYDGTSARCPLRRLPAFDFSSLTGGNGGMTGFLPELEILPHLDYPKCTHFLSNFKQDYKLSEIDFSFIDTATFDQTFTGTAITKPVITDFKASTSINTLYANCPNLDPDFSAYTFKSSAPKVNLGGLFFQTKVSAMPRLEFNDVSALSSFFEWNTVVPTVIPDMSMWGNVTTVNGFLHGVISTNAPERIEGLDFASVSDATNFLWSYNRFPKLRFIRILNLGKGSCATYDFSDARCWGEDTPDHPDARKSLVDTLLTDSHDRAAAGLPPATIRLYSTVRNRLTAEELAAITAKGFTLS